MEELKRLKKDELIARVEELELENISLRAEVTILREQAIKRAPSK